MHFYAQELSGKFVSHGGLFWFSYLMICWGLNVYEITWFLVEPCLFLKVLSRSGKAEVLTSPHRPYGSNQASLQEIKRIREAGGWVCFPCSFIFSHSFWPSSVVNILYYYMSIFNIVKIEVLIWKLWQLRMRTNLSYLGYETIFSFLVLLFMYCGLVVRETKTCNTVCFPQWNHSQILSWY